MRQPSPIMVKQLVVGQMATNCYLLIDPIISEAIVVDPGDDPEYIMENLELSRARPIAIVATHGHFDHLLASRAVQVAYGLSFLIHPADLFLVEQMAQSARYYLRFPRVDPPPQITATLGTGQFLKLGSHRLTILPLPGHTPGSIGLYAEESQTLLVGDTLFAGGGLGRTDFSYSDPGKFAQSVREILGLPSETKLYPGHGQTTSIGAERKLHSV